MSLVRKKEGIRLGEPAVLRRQLERKFGALGPEVDKRLQQADVDLLLVWSDRILTATKLDDVFEV